MQKVLLMTFNCSYIHPNLALRWLYVSRDPRYEVIIKEYILKDSLQKVKEEIEKISPDIIGLSIYIWNSEITKDLIRLINQDHRYRIIIGGPEVSFEYESWLDEEIEGVIRGEGEISFWKACNKEDEIDGYVTKDYKSNVDYALVDIDYLESLQSPYYLEFDNQLRKNRYMYFESSRGCPYRCSYCLSSIDTKVRNFSLEYIKKQLSLLPQYPCKQVKFLDRTFNSHPLRALEIASFINDLDVDMSFQFEVALEHFPINLLEFFAHTKPGKFRFEVGVQSFNNKTLKAICRIQDADKLVKNISYFKNHGLVMHTDLIAGLPYEDYDSFKQSFFSLFKLHTDEIQMGILKLLKGTALKAQGNDYGIIYNSLPPYEVISTNWINKQDMDKIKYCAKVIDKTYNNHRLRHTFDQLFDLGYDIFEIMAEYGLKLSKIEKLQVNDYFMELAKILKSYDVKNYQGLLLNDYYHQFNEKPKALFSRPDIDIRKNLFKQLINQGYDEHRLNEYSVFDYAYINGEMAYQLVFYSKYHHMDTIEYYDLDLKRIHM